ncbi:MAG TPA: ATP-binding protein [Caulobacteraceae bacterium]|nr:ATP-binding protein [Caulobacteraceae bacterium]
MSELKPTAEAQSHAPFQARVASVALVTTVAVLLAACASFMLQQWAVSREDSRLAETTRSAVVAQIAAPSLAANDITAAKRAVAAAASPPAVVSATLLDERGRVIAHEDHASNDRSPLRETVRTPIIYEGRPVGELVTVVRPPAFSTLLPRYLALTFALFFGAAGLALFLGRGLSRRVTEPVMRLSSAMREVTASGRFTPVKEDAADDDLFRSLARSFNQLLAKLDENDRSLRETMADLVEARDQANAANVLKSQFLANMSHEIRTPLNGVLAMADVMAIDHLSDKQRERLGVIRTSGELLLAVINDVLDLSKIEAGRLELVPQDFALEALAEGIQQTFEHAAAEKGLALSVSVDEAARGSWRGDPDRLRQIVANLVSNAIKFTSEGCVEARFQALGEGLRLSVVDTGIGIGSDKLPQLFDKFTQADSSTTRQFGGTGLGLAICRELAQLMGGNICAESVEGKGSVFTVELPLRRGGPIVEAAETPANEEAEGEARRIRVLAAEDNATNQKVLRAVMEPLDADLTMVADGREAVEAWRLGAFDLILMDIQMPVMDGVEATRAIRQVEATEQRARIPILALTANALVHQVEEYAAAGMDGHISKPIELPRLYEAIDKAFSASARAEARAA